MAGFGDEHKSIKIFFEAAKKCSSLILQFGDCRTRLILRVNSGDMPLRLRGSKADDVKADFKFVRDRVVEKISMAGTYDDDDYIAMTVERYMETHDDRTPADDGLDTVKRKRDGKLVDCVLLRTLPDGEWKVKVRHGEEARDVTTVDDGKNVISEDQQGAKFERMAGPWEC